MYLRLPLKNSKVVQTTSLNKNYTIRIESYNSASTNIGCTDITTQKTLIETGKDNMKHKYFTFPMFLALKVSYIKISFIFLPNWSYNV